ncbi:MAG: DUF937 domain-containing protein [Bryobacterales bacterium]|nr:DUF937 domain-containing protein [Bryobacterales bacterium]
MELLAQIRNALSADSVRRASDFIGADESRTRRAIGQLIPTIMAASINLVSTDEGAFSFQCMLQEGRHVNLLMGELPSLLTNRGSARSLLSVGERAIDRLMGNQAAAVAHAIAEECGITESAAAELMQLVSLAMLGLFGGMIGEDQITKRGVIDAIRNQRRVTARALPPEVAKVIELFENPPQEMEEVLSASGWSLRKLRLFRLFT